MGGSTVHEIVTRIMYRVLTNEIGQKYSWEGGKGKQKFNQLPVMKIIYSELIFFCNLTLLLNYFGSNVIPFAVVIIVIHFQRLYELINEPLWLAMMK